MIAGFLPCHLRMEYEAALHRLVAGFVPFALRLFCSPPLPFFRLRLTP